MFPIKGFSLIDEADVCKITTVLLEPLSIVNSMWINDELTSFIFVFYMSITFDSNVWALIVCVHRYKKGANVGSIYSANVISIGVKMSTYGYQRLSFCLWSHVQGFCLCMSKDINRWTDEDQHDNSYAVNFSTDNNQSTDNFLFRVGWLIGVSTHK